VHLGQGLGRKERFRGRTERAKLTITKDGGRKEQRLDFEAAGLREVMEEGEHGKNGEYEKITTSSATEPAATHLSAIIDVSCA
jgi:hypothetical protein